MGSIKSVGGNLHGSFCWPSFYGTYLSVVLLAFLKQKSSSRQPLFEDDQTASFLSEGLKPITVSALDYPSELVPFHLAEAIPLPVAFYEETGKVDTRLYIKGLSGPLVFRALYGIIASFLLFSALYILAGVFPAVLIGVPAFFGYLYRLNIIQKKYGPEGWGKKQTARRLPRFISCKRRIHPSYSK